MGAEMTAETTMEPEDPTCECGVSVEDFNSLRETVRALQSTVASLDTASVETMLNEYSSTAQKLSEVATCMADVFDDDKPEETDKPEEPTETTMMEDKESTMMDETTMMRDRESTMMPEPETTMMPEPETTQPEWAEVGTLDAEGMICGSNQGRTFKLAFTSIKNCLIRCRDDTNCNYATTDEKTWCIGCPVEPNSARSDYDSYKVTYPERRQLSELEQLRAENAALKAALAKVRRN